MVQRPRIHEKKNETNHETISHRFEIQQIPVESQTRQDLGGALDHTEDDEYRHIHCTLYRGLSTYSMVVFSLCFT